MPGPGHRIVPSLVIYNTSPGVKHSQCYPEGGDAACDGQLCLEPTGETVSNRRVSSS